MLHSRLQLTCRNDAACTSSRAERDRSPKQHSPAGASRLQRAMDELVQQASATNGRVRPQKSHALPCRPRGLVAGLPQSRGLALLVRCQLVDAKLRRHQAPGSSRRRSKQPCIGCCWRQFSVLAARSSRWILIIPLRSGGGHLQTGWELRMPKELHETVSAMRSCILSCQNCSTTCSSLLVDYCMKTGGRHAAPKHVRIMLDCAEVCTTISNFMARSSTFHSAMCRLCADVCDACARSCDGLDGMAECIATCCACSKSCRAIVAMG